jgi:hypothetical protein
MKHFLKSCAESPRCSGLCRRVVRAAALLGACGALAQADAASGAAR